MSNIEMGERQYPDISVTTLIRVVEMGGVGAGLHVSRTISSIDAMHELGIIFLTEDDANEHVLIEGYFSSILYENTDPDLAIIALHILKNDNAFLSKNAQKIVDEYISDPAHDGVMQKLKK